MWGIRNRLATARDRSKAGRRSEDGRAAVALLAGVLLAALLVLYVGRQPGRPPLQGPVGQPLVEAADTFRVATRRPLKETPSAIELVHRAAPEGRLAPGTGLLRGAVHLGAGRDPAPVHLTLRAMGTHDPDGLPLEGAPEPRRSLTLLPGSTIFAEPVPYGLWEASATAEGFAPGRVSTWVSSTSPSPFLSLSLKTAGFIEGWVTGTPIPEGGLPVTLTYDPDQSGAAWAPEITVRTDASGGFRFPTVRDGPCVLRVGGNGLRIADGLRIDFRGPSLRQDLEVEPCGALEVTVLDTDGLPVQGTSVRAYRAGGYGSLARRTGPDGRVSIPALPAGDWDVTVVLPGQPRAKQWATIEAGERAALTFQADSPPR